MAIKTLFLCLLVSLLACCTIWELPVTLDTVVDLNAVARGGKVAIEQVHSVQLELEITEPGIKLTALYKATRDGWMRIDVALDGTRVFTEAIGPRGGWQMDARGNTLNLSIEGEQALRRGIVGNLYGLHERASLGYRLELLGSTTYRGIKVWDIEQKSPDGFSQHLYLARDTALLIVETESSALHPDVEGSEIMQETRHSDYKATAGVLFAEKSEKRNIISGLQLQSARITSRVVNPPIDPSYFDQ